MAAPAVGGGPGIGVGDGRSRRHRSSPMIAAIACSLRRPTPGAFAAGGGGVAEREQELGASREAVVDEPVGQRRRWSPPRRRHLFDHEAPADLVIGGESDVRRVGQRGATGGAVGHLGVAALEPQLIGDRPAVALISEGDEVPTLHAADARLVEQQLRELLLVEIVRSEPLRQRVLVQVPALQEDRPLGGDLILGGVAAELLRVAGHDHAIQGSLLELLEVLLVQRRILDDAVSQDRTGRSLYFRVARAHRLAQPAEPLARRTLLTGRRVQDRLPAGRSSSVASRRF